MSKREDQPRGSATSNPPTACTGTFTALTTSRNCRARLGIRSPLAAIAAALVVADVVDHIIATQILDQFCPGNHVRAGLVVPHHLLLCCRAP